MLGFDTIGNATLIAYDGEPVLACDPWIQGGAYFGSWCLAHEIPSDQLDAIRRSRYVWFSHAHPDHLNGDSLDALAGQTILLADHVGGRVARDLTGMGFSVRVLKGYTWHQLSPRIRVMTIADPNQDSIILVDVGGKLVINLNDASDRGWGYAVRRIAEHYGESYLMRLAGYGDADMINLWTPDGRRIEPVAARRPSVGARLAQYADVMGARYVIPFSSFHAYQREDSVWAAQYATPLSAHREGFDSKRAEILPAFVRVTGDSVTELRPREREVEVLPPSAFGDDWSEPLDAADRAAVIAYFKARRRLEQHFGFVAFRVGGQEAVVDLNPRRRDVGITFEAPRASLMTAIRYEIFDDLLIGNFMRTTLHGGAALYPHFTPVVAKHADNGRAMTRADYARYWMTYLMRAPVDMLRHLLEAKSEDVFRRFVSDGNPLYPVAKRAYWALKR